jgi:opacity protein-like surface antigen
MPGIKHFAAIFTGALASTSAMAADMQMPPPVAAPISQERLEFGTGWYLRGDISWTREKSPVLFPTPAPGPTLNLKNQNGWALGIGAGYKLNNWFRTDLTFDYYKQLSVNTRSANFTCYDAINPVNDINGNVVALHAQENSCYSRTAGQVSRAVALWNGYIDLGTWSGITPYVGAGLGMSFGRAKSSSNWYFAANDAIYNPTLVLPNPSPIPELWLEANGNPIARPITAFGPQNRRTALDRKNYNFAYAFMTGIAYDVSPNAKIDFGYRFVNLGKLGAATKATTINEYRIGFRYMID